MQQSYLAGRNIISSSIRCHLEVKRSFSVHSIMFIGMQIAVFEEGDQKSSSSQRVHQSCSIQEEGKYDKRG